jgi:hypothetical protein
MIPALSGGTENGVKNETADIVVGGFFVGFDGISSSLEF